MCLFCIAVFAMLAGTITTAVLDEMESRLTQVATTGSVARLTDTGTTATIAAAVPVPGVAGQPKPAVPAAPVLITVYKAQKRVRIQVQTHDVTEAQAHAIQDLVATACGLKVMTRSSDQTQHQVQEATQHTQTAPLPSGRTQIAQGETS